MSRRCGGGDESGATSLCLKEAAAFSTNAFAKSGGGCRSLGAKQSASAGFLLGNGCYARCDSISWQHEASKNASECSPQHGRQQISRELSRTARGRRNVRQDGRRQRDPTQSRVLTRASRKNALGGERSRNQHCCPGDTTALNETCSPQVARSCGAPSGCTPERRLSPH